MRRTLCGVAGMLGAISTGVFMQPALAQTPITPPPPATMSGTTSGYSMPELPTKWGRPASNWESQAKLLNQTNAAPAPPEPRPAPPPAMTWRRPPGGSEASEPRSSAPAVLYSARRWPPAYEPGLPASSKAKPGVITFDEEPPPTPQRGFVTRVGSLFPGSADLQRQIQSACGQKAGEVRVETQPNGIMLVKVKVPNLSVEDELTRKIFAIPGMTSPNVRLIMDVGP